ncbi:AI-2E family transporter [Candidatus Binatia bacterium]|nr:AI-2E family transporter [Candidatus Binatia bacterium]
MALNDDAEPSAAITADAAAQRRRLNTVAIFIGCTLAVAVLYWTQAVLIPIALAVLLSFLLSPVVRGFERIGLGRIGSVAVVTVLAFALLASVGFALAWQATRLADELPAYRSNIRAKIVDVQGATSGGIIDKVRAAADDVMSALDRGAGRRAAQRGLAASSRDSPVPVVMQAPSVLWQIPSLLEGLASAGFVLVLVIFMLLERRDLRDRLIRLIGYGRLAVTTRAFDEAAARIGRYLVAQSLLNAGYGATVGAGLYLLDVPYALLWGFLAACLRFVPYVGPFLGAAMPVLIALAAFPGWRVPLLAVTLFAACELIANMIVEPLLYGQSAGVSQVSLLAAIAFWTWLWGPIGLVLATPLTVCLVVMSKHVPELHFIYYLLADEQVLEPDVRLYQRLLAADDEEAREILADYSRLHPECDAYDELLLPVLVRTSDDRGNGRLTSDEEHRMHRAARRLLTSIARAAAAPGTGDAAPETTAARVLGCPASGQGDALVLQILMHELARDPVLLERLWPGMGSLEILANVEAAHPHAICIAALPPRGAVAARYLCRRIRRQFPNVPIVVVLPEAPGERGSDTARALASAGATAVVEGTRAAREALLEVVAASGDERRNLVA